MAQIIKKIGPLELQEDEGKYFFLNDGNWFSQIFDTEKEAWVTFKNRKLCWTLKKSA